jgi:hypothetical protein
MKRFTSHPRRTAIATALVFLALAGAAAAYFLVFASGSAQQTVTLGTQSTHVVDMEVVGIPNGLNPGDTSPTWYVHAAVPEGYNNPIQVSSVDYQVLIDGAPAPDGLFTIADAPGQPPFPLTLTPGSGWRNIGDKTITFNDNGSDQSALAGKSLTVKATVH